MIDLFVNLQEINTKSIEELTKPELIELQRALKAIGYTLGRVDGLNGPRTQKAWAKFKKDTFQSEPSIVGAGSIKLLKQKVQSLFPINKPTDRKSTIEAIIQYAPKHGLILKTQISYILATAHWETNNTFEPVMEAYWLSEDWRRRNLSYHPWFGRGLTQITHKSNYEYYSDIFGQDFVSDPDKVLEPNVSLFIILHGFKYGTFTDKTLEDYVNVNQTDWFNARRCINGLDKAKEIAALARDYMKIL